MSAKLPDEIEDAIARMEESWATRGAYSTPEWEVLLTDEQRQAAVAATNQLRAAIGTALTNVDARRARAEHEAWATLFTENEGLRARCERLRQGVLYASRMGSPDLLFGMHILESDMADDLGPTADEGKRP